MTTPKIEALLKERAALLALIEAEWPEERQHTLAKLQQDWNNYSHMLRVFVNDMLRVFANDMLRPFDGLNLERSDEEVRQMYLDPVNKLSVIREQAREAKKQLDASGYDTFRQLRAQLDQLNFCLETELKAPSHKLWSIV